jgi:MFS family permease
MTAPDSTGSATRRGFGLSRELLALIVGQIGLHSCMAGIRMAAPLQALRQGHNEWAVGLLVGLFALAPVVLAMPAGRMVDRHGYHRPVRIAVALTVSGGMLAALSSWMDSWSYVTMCLAACLVGAGANIGLIAIQRTASRTARDTTELKRVFSWLGLAPAISNVIGPVLAGVMIDMGGFKSAYLVLLLLPLVSGWWARRVPHETPIQHGAVDASNGSWSLLMTPGLRRLLLINWLFSASWDVHTFVVPILGHERGFSASAIGLVLGSFSVSVAAVRVVIPGLAHRLNEPTVLLGAVLWSAAVFAVYPLVHSSWAMMTCAVLLGLSLGAVQPMIMSALHQITPAHRHGEAIALRSMTLNISSVGMPLLFGIAGTAMGSATLFWLMSAALMAGSSQLRHLARHAGSKASSRFRSWPREP